MKIFKSFNILNKEINFNHRVGFVPTMGSLHPGHISLIKKAKKKSQTVLVSIFINPSQFNEKKDFLKYVNTNYSFNRENLFICRSKKLMNAYFTSVFSWLERCESVFGFNLEGYSKTRIYAFLAERYISYWFNKYSNPLEWPIFFFDTNKNKLNLIKKN